MKKLSMEMQLGAYLAVIFSVFIAISAPAVAQNQLPYTMVEAATSPSGQVVPDKAAFGGSYVTQSNAWQPMIICPLPSSGDSWVIWARLKDVNVQLKAIAADGTQTALNWEWQQPDDWTWVSMGRHTRTELESKIMLMRGPTAGSSPGLDAVVFAADDSFDPNVGIPAPKVIYPAVTVGVDWQKTIADATSLSYGLNAFGGFDPAITYNVQYEANMAQMHAGLLRLHDWGMMNDSTQPTGWLDTQNKRWDENKITKDLVGAYAYGPTLLINIPSWPTWMDNNGMLADGQEDAFAQFCADLVRIVNVKLKLHVKYWEVTNERDGPYYGDFHDNGGALKNPAQPDHVSDLVDIYNKCAVAMKMVDPTIKVGGPAAARPDWLDFVGRFAAGTSSNLDFFSFHAYGSGSKDDSDQHIFDRATGFGDDVLQIRQVLAKSCPGRNVPVFFDEYNISWTWETRDPRMTNAKGAIFDALAITAAVDNGAVATAAWNEKDGIYGKMDDAYNLRPGAALFTLLNNHMVGSVAATTSSEPNAVAAYGVKRPNGNKALLLINRSNHDRTISLDPGNASMKILASISAGASPSQDSTTKEVTLPSDSLALLGGAVTNPSP